MNEKETQQDTNWFEVMAKRLATDEDFAKAYKESLNSQPFTEQAQKDIAEYLASGDDMFDYLLTKQTNRKENQNG